MWLVRKGVIILLLSVIILFERLGLIIVLLGRWYGRPNGCLSGSDTIVSRVVGHFGKFGGDNSRD